MKEVVGEHDRKNALGIVSTGQSACHMDSVDGLGFTQAPAWCKQWAGKHSLYQAAMSRGCTPLDMEQAD